jgi:hypothetical protein
VSKKEKAGETCLSTQTVRQLAESEVPVGNAGSKILNSGRVYIARSGSLIAQHS